MSGAWYSNGDAVGWPWPAPGGAPRRERQALHFAGEPVASGAALEANHAPPHLATPGGDQAGPPKRRRRGWLILVWVLFGAGVAAWMTVAVVLHRAAPILRARVINTLGTMFDSRVELDSLDVSMLAGLEVHGRGLRLFPHALDRDEASFSVGEFRFRTSPWSLFRSPMHVGRVDLTDLEVYRPSKNERAAMRAQSQAHAVEPGKHQLEVVVDELVVDRAQLRLGTDKPGKAPLLFEIHGLTMDNVGRNQAMHFHALLENPKPIGEIDSSGWFGPYNTVQPGESPVRGDYRFSQADLGTIKGIRGTLSSTGHYSGRIDQITVDGTTDTPNFELETARHPMRLTTRFHAVVDGLNGNTYLQPVVARLGGSQIVARGEVTREAKQGAGPGQTGRHVRLAIQVGPQADIYDLLRLAARTSPPVMHGRLQLQTAFDLPAGVGPVPERMRLKGHFQIAGATFTNGKVQGRIDGLSLRAQGRPGEVQGAAERAPIESAMQGNFALEDARLTLSGMDYQVPGAEVLMDGVYTLDGRVYDFAGRARMHAHVSEMVTGWKQWPLKLVDPFLAKHGAGTEVPFTVTGTQSEPQIGVFGMGKKHGQ